MSDNVVANAGSGGATFATDDISGVHYPINKLAYGALDSATLVDPTNPLPSVDKPAASGGLSASKTVSAASTNATSVKGSAGQVYSIAVSSINAAARYLKLYNKATAPTVGTDVPVLTLVIPGNAAGAGFVWNIDKGIAFSSGIAFALTTGIADSDTGAVSANEHAVNILYK